MNGHCLKVLEFERILEFLGSFAASPGGRNACKTLMPQTGHGAVVQLLQETTEMRYEQDLHGPLPLSGIHSIRTAVEQARMQNYYLEPQRLIEISDTLETADIIRNYFSGHADSRPLLHAITSRIAPLDSITRRIRTCISSQAELLDSASPALADIRRQIKKLRSGIIRTLEHMLVDVELGTAIQDDFITLRNNRYVIPVRSDSKNTIPGVVHDQSQSKATFFVEPLSVVNQNNELQGLRKDEYYEEIRILTELTGLINARGPEICENLDIIERVDLIHAKALFARALRATCPEINTTGVIGLRACRHPILLSRFIEDPAPAGNTDCTPQAPTGAWVFDRSAVVPIDCLKSTKSSTLIITGANAGGKTVAMKTIGLFVLMTQAGMHIPVEARSTIAVFDSVFADIGDEQNMETSLSTFSSHMSQIQGIISQVTPSSLVLLDELGSGTDPSEGGALAVAILDFLRKRGCTTIVTTHLTIMKTYAYSRYDVENVSVAFDPGTLKPSYSLVYGMPGFSNAIAIARSIGIPEEILQSAGGYLEGADRQVAELIHGLEKTQKELSDSKEVLRTAIRLARRYHNAAESLHDSMHDQREKILKNFETQARSLLRHSEDELMKIIKDQKKRTVIRPDDDYKQDDAARRALTAVKKKLHGQFPEKSGQHEQIEHIEHLEAGQAVMVVHLHKQGIVMSADNGAKKAEVAIGPMRVKTGYHELALSSAPAGQAKGPSLKKPAKTLASSAEPAFARRVNVIGMRVEEALPVVDKGIDTALLEGADTVEVIHGRGTGRLMAAIHEHLKTHPYVASFAQGTQAEGGSGLTIIQIK
jgi:DNA mismatch repair protein MutS2